MTRYESQDRPDCYKRCLCANNAPEHCYKIRDLTQKCLKCGWQYNNVGKKK